MIEELYSISFSQTFPLNLSDGISTIVINDANVTEPKINDTGLYRYVSVDTKGTFSGIDYRDLKDGRSYRTVNMCYSAYVNSDSENSM